jgi:hypothetical protein
MHVFRSILGLGLLLALAGAASAAVVVGTGGETLFVLKSERDLDKTAQERAGDVYDRLRYILNNPRFKATDIQVKPLGNYGAKIVANNHLIVPIGAREAEANGSTPMKLAEDWAVHLRKVMPKLNARPDLFAKRYKQIQQKKRR